MEKVVYNEDVISSHPGGAEVYEHLQGLKDELDRMEGERDNMLALLHEIADAEDIEEADEVLVKIREYIEHRPYPTPY